MIPLSTIPVRFCPSKETLSVLNDRQWICSYSGGKDSTTLVTWIEWLRRAGMVTCKTPRLVMSDTTVEYPFLRGIADRLMARLTASGWECVVVSPPRERKLYCMIFGRGVTPVHPGFRRRMRWCTRATKVDPMRRFSRTVASDVTQLSGVRWGESDIRDGKLKATGCAAGGECGLPEPGKGVFGPIITWTTCKVIEWLEGKAGGEVNAAIADLLPMMRELVVVYDVKQGHPELFGASRVTSGLRFGCIGCPAISNEKITTHRNADQRWSALRRLWDIWQALYLRKNRCCRLLTDAFRRHGSKWPKAWGSEVGYGPIRMAARKHYFAELLDIQQASGVTLVTPEDIAFIHDCWERKVYPRGWSEADELVQPPEDGLFAGKN